MSIPPSTGGPPQRFPNPHGHFDDSSNKPPFGQQSGQGMRYKNKTINSIYYNQTVVFVVVDLKDLHLETEVVVQAITFMLLRPNKILLAFFQPSSLKT
jgi:hypothetical protein